MSRFCLPAASALVLAAGLILAPAAWAGTITITSQDEVKAAPDQVSVSAGVNTSAATAAQALSANTTRMATVFAALERLGVPQKDIQTVNFSVSPQYADGPGAAPRLTGYQVSNEVRVLLADVTKLGGALDALVQAGANQMNGISYDIADPGPLMAAAQAGAVADARARAETYAKAAGVRLGAIQSISEGSGDMPRPVMFAMAAPRMGKAVPVAAGQQSVSASVTIVWAIE